ncbi:MAG: sodium:solute symporter family protein [Pseudomonadota bacterium]
MFGLSYLDLGVIFIYFAALTAIGIATGKAVKNTGDFFMGGRRFGKLLMIGHAMGTGTHTDQPVTVSGASYSIGLAGIWYQWIWMFSTPFFWLLAPIYRRLRYITIGDFFERRYGPDLGAAYAVMGLVYFTLNCGLMLKGTGTTIDAVTGGAVPTEAVVLILTVLFVTYSLVGGLVAAVITDFIQGIFILVLSFLLIPFAINAAGGYMEIREGLPDEMFSFVAPIEVTGFFIAMSVINGLFSVVVQPHHMAVGGAGKAESAGRWGWTYGNFLKRIMTLGWAFTGVFAAFLFADVLTEDTREEAFGLTVRELLPSGLVGLMVASMAAAVMSSCDSFMVGGSALFTRNFYRRYFKREGSEEHFLSVARYASLAVVVGGLIFALLLPNVVEGVKIIWKFTALFGVGFWVALFWERATGWGVWASIVVMGACMLVTDRMGWTLPQQIALYLPAGLVAIGIVSLLTPRTESERLRQFYGLLRTPVGEEYKLKEQGIEIVEEGLDIEQEKREAKPLLERGHSLVLVDLLKMPGAFTWAKYRIDVGGFLVAWGVVGLLFLFGWFTTTIGAN